MPDNIYIGMFKGLKLNPLPFNIDNDSFAYMFNMYAWRGRAKRKRGTSTLARLQRQIQMADPRVFSWQAPAPVVVGGAVNIFTGIGVPEANPSVTPKTINFTYGGQTFTEPSIPNGTLVGSGGGTATINYATGDVQFSFNASPLTGFFSYFPNLANIGLEDLIVNGSNSNFPDTMGFDRSYSYQINQAAGNNVFWYTTDYYKNTNIQFLWSNDDSNLFWTCNYQSAFWATNNKPGFHFKSLTNSLIGAVSVIQQLPTQVQVGLTAHGLITGDFIWFNEVTGSIATGSGTTLDQNINGKTGKVTVIDPNTLQVNFSNEAGTISIPGTSITNFQVGATGTGGIAQYLTNTIAGQDGIRWYDGDPTKGTGLPPLMSTGLGWVNFAPPLTASTVSINDQVKAKYYLVGCLAILPYKDRLVFFAPQIQSVGGPVIQMALQDTVIWSWNGTPYYTALVPTPPIATETFDETSSNYYVDQTGKGGFLSAGLAKPIMTVTNNEDVLLVGFGGTGNKTRFVYTGNDLNPFLFYLINSEIPSSCTFSGITLDRGGIEIGSYGITLTTQQSSQRIDLDIPDSVFQIQALNGGQKRVNAIRDFFREWIYFAYPIGNGKETNGSWKYPAQTFLWNYRDNTWAILRENFTIHGNFRVQNFYTWKTLPFKTWAQWKEPWNAGSSVALFPNIIAGNPQGFVVKKDQGTGEAPTGSIQAIASDGTGFTRITSPNHCVNTGDTGSQGLGDYLFFQGAIGQTFLNNKIGRVIRTTDANTFDVDIPFVAGTYLGLGLYTRLIQPLIQTKQFPVYWEQGRQVRLGTQKYLLDTTASGQVTVNIYLSQDADNAYNAGPINPDPGAENNALVSSQVLFTCPESTNLGLTPANVNLQMPTASTQFQIWHRINTSLIGESVQIGITLSDAQMRDLTIATSEIALHAIHLQVYPGPILA